MQVPSWAQQLITQVQADYHLPTVEVTWRVSRKKSWWFRRGERMSSYGRRKSSSGRAYTDQKRIVITAGAERRDQRLVLLHELAHLIRPPREHHSPAFWDTAFELFKRYGVPMRYALAREKAYRQEAAHAYERLSPRRVSAGSTEGRKKNMAEKKQYELAALAAGFSGRAARVRVDKGTVEVVHKASDGKTLCGADVTVVTPNMENYHVSWKSVRDDVDCGRCIKAEAKASGAKPAKVKKAVAKSAATKSARSDEQRANDAQRARDRRAAKKAQGS